MYVGVVGVYVYVCFAWKLNRTWLRLVVGYIFASSPRGWMWVILDGASS